MAEIPLGFLNCIAYIYPDADAEKRGAEGGTAFNVAVRLGFEDWSQGYVVTAAHVLGDEEASRDPVVRVNLRNGKTMAVTTQYEGWFVDDDNDIAVYPLEFDIQSTNFTVIAAEQFLSKKLIETYQFGPGNDVFVLGRLVGHEGKSINLPSARFGNIPMMPGEPHRRPPKNDIEEVFLVELRSIGGYSGAPAFIYEAPFHLNNRQQAVHRWSHGPHLLGLDIGHIQTKEPLLEEKLERGRKVYSPVKGKFSVTNTAIAIVVPAWKILDLLNRNDIVQKRENDPKYLAALTAAKTD